MSAELFVCCLLFVLSGIFVLVIGSDICYW